MSKIFLSYRRSDSQWQTKAVYEALRHCVSNPQEDIFFDLDSMTIGRNFRDRIDEAVEQCDILIAVIGPKWLSEVDQTTGLRRLDDPNDFVRIEIAAALKRDIPVVPVLLDGTPIPAPEQLPSEIRELAFRHGVKVRPDSFAHDVGSMISGLGLQKPDSGPESRSAGMDAISAIRSSLSQAAASVSGLTANPDLQTEAAKAWKLIQGSLSVTEYQRFMERFRGTAESFEAERRLDQIESWRSVDETDLAAVKAWIYGPGRPDVFPALRDYVRRKIAQLESQLFQEKLDRRMKRTGSGLLGWLKWMLLAAPIVGGVMAADNWFYQEIETYYHPILTILMVGALPGVVLVRLIARAPLRPVFVWAALTGPIGGLVLGTVWAGDLLIYADAEFYFLLLLGLAGGSLLTAIFFLIAWPWRRRPVSPT